MRSSIGDFAFAGQSIEKVHFADGLETIGENAFAYNKLSEIKLPDSVKTIEDHAFESNPLTVIDLGNVETIGEAAFKGNSEVTSLRLGNQLRAIGDYVFEYYGDVNWNTGVRAFPAITELTLPDTLETIGSGFFSPFVSIKELTIGDSVREIGEYAFSGMTQLEKVKLSNNMREISNCLFEDCSNLKEVILGKNTTRIGLYAFYGCSSLQKVELGESITHIDRYAFSGCSSLEKAELGEKITYIGSNAFSGCASLTELALPDTVTHLDDCFISGCSGISSFTIPATMENLNTYSFSGANGLVELRAGKNLRTGLENDVIAKLPNLERIVVDEYNETYSSYKGALMNKAGTKLFTLPMMAKEYIMPESVLSYGNTTTFANHSALTTVKLNDNVTQIPSCKNCTALKTLEPGAKVSTLIPSQFEGCTALEEFTFSGTNVRNKAFKDCTALKKVVLKSLSCTVSKDAFEGCEGTVVYCYRNSYTHNQLMATNDYDKLTVKYINDDFYVTDPEVTALSSGSVSLRWKQPKDTDTGVTYNVYRDGVKIASRISLPSYTDSGLTSGTAYRYEITAVDVAGYEGEQKVDISVTPACSSVQNISAPAPNAEIGGTKPITLKASMTDGMSSKGAKGAFLYSYDGEEFTLIGNANAEYTGVNYTGTWDLTPMHSGKCTLRFLFTDKDGGTSFKDTTVTIDRTAPATTFSTSNGIPRRPTRRTSPP